MSRIDTVKHSCLYPSLCCNFFTVEDDGTIVALGTGNACLSSDSLSEDGRVLIDSYAVATARRALLK